MKDPVPFDKMTIREIESDLKRAYAKLQKTLDPNGSRLHHIGRATDHLSQLRFHMERLRKKPKAS